MLRHSKRITFALQRGDLLGEDLQTGPGGLEGLTRALRKLLSTHVGCWGRWLLKCRGGRRLAAACHQDSSWRRRGRSQSMTSGSTPRTPANFRRVRGVAELVPLRIRLMVLRSRPEASASSLSDTARAA